MLSIPATKGFEIGSGFECARLKGSQHNDRFLRSNGIIKSTSSLGNTTRSLVTETNRSGGVQGGISNGEPLVFRVAFKAPATIGQSQMTASFPSSNETGDKQLVNLEAKGRHDPCVVPRAIPIVEAMTALVIADLAMIQEGR